MRKRLNSWYDDCQDCGAAVELVVEASEDADLAAQAWTCPRCHALRVVDCLSGEIIAVKRLPDASPPITVRSRIPALERVT